MPRHIVLSSLLSAALLAALPMYSQEATTSPNQGAATPQAIPEVPAGPQTVRWNPPPNFDPKARPRYGRMVESGGIKVIAGISDDSDYNFTRINLEIVNESGKPIQFDPAKVTLDQVQPKEKHLKQQDPLKLARIVEGNEEVLNQGDHNISVGRSAGGFAATGGKPGVGTQAKDIHYEGRDYTFTEFLRETRLKPGQLDNSTRAVGGIYFELSKKRTQVLLRVPIGDITFEIPFEGVEKN